MITVAILNIIIVLFAYLARYRRTKFGLKVSFFLIFLFLALRYDYGNDYPAYLDSFLEMNQYGLIDYLGTPSQFEIGWIFLCRLFKPFGFFAMTAVLALFNCFVYYRFIKKYVPPVYYWFAVFLYVFTPELMLINSSAMRQSVAINLFIYSIDYLIKKDAIRYFLCIGLASLFHTSALILLPGYLIVLFHWKSNIPTAVSIFAFFLFLFYEPFTSNTIEFINIYFNKYAFNAVEAGGTVIGTGFGLLLFSALFALVLFYDRFQTKEISLLFKIAILSYLIIPLVLTISILGRITLYFQPATLAVFPIILSNIKEQIFKYILLFSIIFVTFYFFFQFFQSPVWVNAFGTYITIFSSPEIY